MKKTLSLKAWFATLDRLEVAALVLVIVTAIACALTGRTVDALLALAVLAGTGVMLRRVLGEAVAYGVRKAERRHTAIEGATIRVLRGGRS